MRLVWALSRLARALTAAGRVDRALEIARDLPTDGGLSCVVLTRVAAILARNEQPDRALEVAQLVPNNDGPNNYRGYALFYIAEALTEIGQVERALEVAQSTPRGYQSGTLTKIIEILARTGQIDRALEVTQTLSDPIERASELSRIANVLVKMGERDREALEERHREALEERHRALDLIDQALILVEYQSPPSARP